jgi:cell division protein FtsQ
LVGLVVIGVGVGLGWLVFFSSYLSVQGAEVHGTHVLSAASVEKAAQVPRGGPLATVDLGAIQARVEDLAAVRSADVSRAWPNHVRIDVTERTAVAVVSWEGTWRGLDTEGVLFRGYPSRPAGLPEVRVSSSTPADALVETGNVIGALPTDLKQRVEYLDVRSIDAISLHLRGGAVVTWGSSDQSAEKAAVLQVLLRKPARVYDVTAPGRPTVRR